MGSINSRQKIHYVLSHLRRLDVVCWILIATWLLFFAGNIVGNRYTGWDTQHLGFNNFLYFSDALRSFAIPLWNPLIQGGTFHPNFFNAGNYTPFQWIFLALSYILNPIYAYELMIQITILIGSLGFYLFLRNSGNNKHISLFGTLAFFLSALMPIVGQIMFIFSLSTLPWLLLFCRRILLGQQGISGWVLVFWATVCASFMASGYPWMNVINLAITCLYTCNLIWFNRKDLSAASTYDVRCKFVRSLGFLGGVAILLLCYYLPGYLSLKFYYQQLMGDYISLEPGLRGLGVAKHYSYAGFTESLINSIDKRILMDKTGWSWGTGVVVWMALFYKRIENGFVKNNLIWIVLVIFWVAYSAGSIAFLTDKIPLLNENRWWYIGNYYVSIFIIFLAAANLQHGADQKQHLSLPHFVAASFCILILLFYYTTPIFVFVLVICNIGFFYCLARSNTEGKWREALILLMCLNVAAFNSVPIVLYGTSLRSQERILGQEKDNYRFLIENRVKPVSITVNSRQIDTTTNYLAADTSWLINKTSFNHGYNPLGNPIYWYLKSESFTHSLISMTPHVRLEQQLYRSNFLSDNAFVDAMIKDVRSDATLPTVDRFYEERLKNDTIDFKWTLKKLKQEPNVATINVSVNNAGYLMFNNTYFPGWEVSVNGKKADIVKVNRIFMGVYIESGGDYEIVFKFYPVAKIILLFFPFLVMFFTLIIVISRRDIQRKQIFFFTELGPI